MDIFYVWLYCYKTSNKKNKFVLLARTYNILHSKIRCCINIHQWNSKTLILNGIVEMNGSKCIWNLSDQIYEMINQKDILLH